MKKLAGFGGYWVSPEGRAYRVVGNHYGYIQVYPARFGLKPSKVKGVSSVDLFNLAGELIQQGWVRARDRGVQGWIFEVADVEGQLGVVAEILSRADVGPNELVTISDVNAGGSYYIGEVSEVFSGEILSHPVR